MNRALSVWSVVALLPGAPLFAQPLDEVRFSGRVVARSHLAIRYVAAERWLETIDLSGNDLTAAAWQALARVPAWLRPDLRNTLAVLDDNAQDYYGNLITGVADPLQVDEVAYAVAHSAIEDLELLNGDLLLENAASIYEIAAELSFAELVEHGQPGDDDYHTTVRHAVLVDGVREHYLLPPEIYYRYVVVPVVGFEMLRWLDPSTGRVSVPPTGVFWRDYLYYGGAGDRGYLAPFCLKSPHKIDDAVLAAADFGVARAYGSFIQPESGAVEAIRDAATCAPVAISFVHGDGRCCTGDWPNPDGTIFATLMPLELAAANGSPELLENYLVAGNANARLDLDVSVDTDLATCEFTEQRRRILIVRDRVPFDLATDPNESALAATGFGSDYDVRSSSELPTLALSSTGSPHVNLEYAKIVLVSDQPIDFYRAVAQAAPALESFVDLGGVLEMHLATRRADDWSGLRMPGGVRATAQSEGNRVSAVRAAGYPSLREVLAGASAAWDGRSWPGLAGDRVFDQAESALARIGWWGVRNMPMNFAEIMAWKRCRGLVRSWYPVQIAYNKYGNCGEIADLLDAAARTALIPAVGVGTPLEDHHWGEFFLLDRWHPFQNDWSAAATRIDTWTIAYDADTGGSKSVTEVCSYRGDGLIETVLGRYPPVEVDAAGHIAGDYSRYVTIEVAVSDADGVPVDGALVLVATEAYDDPASLYIAHEMNTDGNGLARVNLGEGNNYYLNVSCEFGAIPTANTVARVVAEADAVPGKLISVAVAFDGRNHDGTVFPEGHVAVPPASLRSYAQSSGERFDLAIDFSAPREISYGVRRYGDYTGEEYRKSYFEPMADASGVVDLYLLDADNYDRYLAGEPFEAAAVFEQTNALTATRSLPDPAIDWYLVVSNRGRLANAQEIDLQATLTASRPDSEDQGCACRAGDTSGSGAVWILALLFGLARVGALAGRSGSRAGR